MSDSQPVAQSAEERQQFDFESAPDVEVFLDVFIGGDLQQKEACVNISRSIIELKQSLSGPLGIPVEYMEIRKGEVLMNDNMRLMDYEVQCDDTIIIKDNSAQ